MKAYILILILISYFLYIKCDLGFPHDEDLGPNNIDVESISYELTYNNYSVVKVVIKSYDELDIGESFIAYLKSYDNEKEYKLTCSSSMYDLIECYSEKNATFNLDDRYYFYYNKTYSRITFDENKVLEDDKQVSLVFKPEIIIDDALYRDNRKFTANTNGEMVSSGYLYITQKTKSALNIPKDGFNKYIELNNFIPVIGKHKDFQFTTIKDYKRAIRSGYHIVDAVLRFTSDKVPVISYEEDLEKISKGEGKISSKTYKELKNLVFGKNKTEEKILSLEILLQLCKEHNVIIDLDLANLNYEQYLGKNDKYSYIILDTIEKYEMFDSLYFSDGPDCKNILKLKTFKKDISVSISNLNSKSAINNAISQFNNSKRLILDIDENSITESLVSYGKSLGKKIKVRNVNSVAFAHKIQTWGVNYMSTISLESFLIENEKVEPIIVRCYSGQDDNSECEIEDDLALRDNEWYNIFYSENIYNISQDIDPTPIGEFLYVDTNILDELYYKVNKLDFEKGIVNLNLSQKLKKGEDIIGIVGPNYYSVPDCYQYNFYCNGSDSYIVDCSIDKEEKGKLPFKGNYCIYDLEDYSLNDFRTDEEAEPEEAETFFEQTVDETLEYIDDVKERPYLLICCIAIVIIIICLIIYYFKYKRPTETYNRIRIADNNYISDNYLYR